MTTDNQNTEHDTEIARLRREHAAMKAFIQRIANRDKQAYMASPISMQILIDDARALLAIYADTAIADTPDTPPAGVTGSGVTDAELVTTIDGIHSMIARGELPYCPIHGEEIEQRLNGSYGCQECDWQQGYPVHEMYPSANAAPPASGSDTVAGSGKGGE